MKKMTVLAGAATLALCWAASARAHVIDPSVDSTLKPALKLRTDVGKQVAKYTFCLVKAATNCEKGGASSAPECDLKTGTASFEPMGGKYTTKFVDAIAKCDAKLNLSKKGTDYQGIGCPGDCDPMSDGLQQCASMAAFQASVVDPNQGVKNQLGALTVLINFECGLDTGAMTTDQVRIDCVTNNAKALTKYAKGLFKCEGKCEDDFKDKKGDGGLDNSGRCLSMDPDVDPIGAFAACDTAALAKAGTITTNVAAVVLPALRKAVNDATEGLYDRFDPTGSPADNPCGTCGNNAREGSEECDGTSDAACPGLCASDCTCP